MIDTFILTYLVPLFQLFGYPLVALAAMVEALPFVGIIIPGGTIIALGGAFASDAGLSVFYMIVAASFGAIIGDFIGFEIGRKYGEQILQKYGHYVGFKDEYLFVTHRFCHQYGGLALVIGRFNNIVRPFVPLVVGSSQMKTSHFWFYNVIGGISWGTFQVLIGYFARESWEVIQQYVGLTGGLLFVGLAISGYFLIRYEVKKLREKRKLQKDRSEESLEK